MKTIIFNEELRKKSEIPPEKLLPLLERIKNRSLYDYARMVGYICIYADTNYLNIR